MTDSTPLATMLGVNSTDAAVDGAAAPSGDVAQPPVASDVKSLEALVGPGKKFATNEDLARGKLEADRFVARLQEENRQARAEIQRLLDQDTGIKELTGMLTSVLADAGPKDTPGRPPGKPADTAASGSTAGAAVDTRAIEGIVTKILEAKTTERERGANLNAAYEGLMQVYGTESEAHVAITNRATLLKLPAPRLVDLARTSPAAFFQIMGVNPSTHQAADAASGQMVAGDAAPLVRKAGRSASASAGGTGTAITAKEGTWAYYEQVRKADPKKYWTAELQNSLYKDLNKDPTSFWGQSR